MCASFFLRDTVCECISLFEFAINKYAPNGFSAQITLLKTYIEKGDSKAKICLSSLFHCNDIRWPLEGGRAPYRSVAGPFTQRFSTKLSEGFIQSLCPSLPFCQYKCDHWTWKILIKQCLFEKEFFDFHWYSDNATSCYRLSSDYCEKMPLVQHFMTALSSSTFLKNSSAFQYLCVVVTYFIVTHINKKILNRASLISQHHILMMTVHISSHHAFPGFAWSLYPVH